MARNMASLDSTVSPGLFMLHLPINKDINIDKAVVETKVRDLNHFLKVRLGRSEEFAIRNLQGLLTLRLRRYEEALGHFRAVLAKDPQNLNALADRQYVLEKLFRLTEAEHCKSELRRLLRPRDDADLPKIKARCLAEQAFAYAFDIHDDTVKGKRYMVSTDLYQKALKLGGTAVETAEQVDWKFCIAFNAYKLFDFQWYEKQRTPTDHIDTAIELFYEITQLNPGHPELQWDSWRHLADIFRAIKNRGIHQDVPGKLAEYKQDPEKCMLKAMEISPNNARLLARYANFLYSLDKTLYEKAMELLAQSISLDSTEFNFYAFTTRATVNLKYYSCHEKSLPMGLLRNVLQLAESDLEKAVAMHVTPWNLKRLGDVYYRLAKNHTKQDSEVRSLIEKALLHFTKAGECQDGYTEKQLHLSRGRCLLEIGEKRSAVGCFKQAIDCEPPTTITTYNINELFGVYLSILREEKSSQDKSIFAETAYSLRSAVRKYGEKQMSTHCISKFRYYYADELQRLAAYCVQFQELGPVASLLVARGPMSSFSPETGGKLRESWARTSLCQESVGASLMPDGASAGIDAPEQVDDIAEGDHDMASLSEDVSKIDIRGPSVKPREQPIRKAPEKARVLSFKYDFCVVYHANQRDWVSYHLLVELEEFHQLKGCTRHRDAVAGTYKLRSEIDLMESSANILLVHDKDFSDECENLMHQAIRLRSKDHSRVVIPILRDTKEIPDELSVFNCFDATGAVDWNKLARCIEQQI